VARADGCVNACVPEPALKHVVMAAIVQAEPL
jgi:hypothetical protein